MSVRHAIRHRVRHSPLLRGLPREVAVLSAVAFCVALGYGILAPVLPSFAKSFGVSNLAATSVLTVFAIMRFVGAPLAGWLNNRLGERTVLATGLVIVAASSAAAGFSQSFTQLLVLRGAGGIGSAMFTVSAMALLLRTVDAGTRGRAVSAYQGGFLIGGIAGPAVGGIVVAWSIRAPFFVYAATLAGAVVVTLAMLRHTPTPERTAADDAAQDAPAADDRLESLGAALRNGAYRAAVGVNFVTGFVFVGLRMAAVPLFIVEGLRFHEWVTSTAFFVAALVQGLLLLPAGRLADTQGRRKALRIGTSALTASMVIVTVAALVHGAGGGALAALALTVLSLAVGGVSGAYLGSAPAAVVGDIAGGRRGGAPVAAFQMTSDLGGIVGPIIAGVLLDVADFTYVFGTATVLAVSAVILVVAMPETLPGRGHRSGGHNPSEPDARA